MKLGFKKIHPDAKLPMYAHEGDAGMDVYAVDDVALPVGIPKLVRTGLIAEIPTGFELQVRPRSGLAVKGITVWNSPGTIDCAYRGEICVILVACNPNNGANAFEKMPCMPYTIHKGDRIAQLVLSPVTKAEIVEVQEVSETDRGAGGFGSTGV